METIIYLMLSWRKQKRLFWVVAKRRCHRILQFKYAWDRTCVQYTLASWKDIFCCKLCDFVSGDVYHVTYVVSTSLFFFMLEVEHIFTFCLLAISMLRVLALCANLLAAYTMFHLETSSFFQCFAYYRNCISILGWCPNDCILSWRMTHDPILFLVCECIVSTNIMLECARCGN